MYAVGPVGKKLSDWAVSCDDLPFGLTIVNGVFGGELLSTGLIGPVYCNVNFLLPFGEGEDDPVTALDDHEHREYGGGCDRYGALSTADPGG